MRMAPAPATAFARLLDAVLGRHGMVVFESNDPAAKPLVADIFARELQFPGRTSSLAGAAGAQLQALGHQPQVTPAADAVALFRIDPKRRLLRRDGNGFSAGDDRFEAAALIAEAVDHPERFSPNVLLRPVVQDAIFPTICYVAGPSELAYLGQLRGVYEHFGVPMPLVHQRGTATLLDSATARFLAKYDVPFQDLQPRDDAALNRLLQAQLPKEVEEALAAAAQQVQQAMERVIGAVPAVDPTLAGAARTTLGKMEHDLAGLQNKVIQAAKKRDETLRRQFTRAQAQMFPAGQPQERTLGMIYLPEPLRPGAGGPADRGPAARERPLPADSVGCSHRRNTEETRVGRRNTEYTDFTEQRPAGPRCARFDWDRSTPTSSSRSSAIRGCGSVSVDNAGRRPAARRLGSTR